MTKQHFLSQLAGNLISLDNTERERILSYYAQMIDERMEDGMTEEAAVQTMESVESIAAEILAEHPAKSQQAVPAQPVQKKGGKGWIVAVCVIVGMLILGIVALAIAGLSLVGCVTNQVLQTQGHGVQVELAPQYSVDAAGSNAMFDPVQTDALQVNWEIGNVYITVSDVEEITLHEEGSLDLDKYPMVLRTDNGGLTVNYAQRTVFDRGISLIKNVDSKDLYVELPADWMGAVTVNVDVGTVTMEGGVLARVDIDAALGEVLLYNVDAKAIRIDADMGNVEVDARFDSLEAYLAAGNLELIAQQGSGRIEHADCDAGEIRIEGDFTYADVDNDMGNVDVVVQGKPQAIDIGCDKVIST